MSYELVGKYEGDTRALASLAALVLAGADGTIANFTGYKATRTQQLEPIIEAFRPKVITALAGEWRNALITQVLPNGCIPPHHDVPPEGSNRYHLVLETNPLCWVMHGGEWQQLEQGGIYRMDPGVTHAAVNWGAMPRTHLVVDISIESRTAQPPEADCPPKAAPA